MTVKQILAELKPLKRMSRPTLYAHLHALKIKPLGVRQSPQRYPDKTVPRILLRLGLKPTNGHTKRKAAR